MVASTDAARNSKTKKIRSHCLRMEALASGLQAVRAPQRISGTGVDQKNNL
jgi:hypothetical protein